MFRLALSVVLTVTASLALAQPAQADEESRERAARKACLSGNFQKGVEILSELFITTKNPVFIYNQGRCLEQNGRFEEAIYRFQEYLRKATRASADDKADAEKHINDCQVLLDKKAARQAGATPEPAAALGPKAQTAGAAPPAAAAAPLRPLAAEPAPISVVTPVPESPALDLSAQTRTSDPQSRPFYKTWWFWTGTAVVAAGAATAIILATRGTSSNVPETPLGNQGALK
jgi:hypothetical protein